MTGDGKVSSRGINSLLCIIVFEKLTDKSIIAILNTMKREFAHNGYRFYDFIQGGILHTLEINRKVNFGWLFGVKTGGRKEYIYAGEKFKEIALERYKNFWLLYCGKSSSGSSEGVSFYLTEGSIKMGLKFQQRAELFWGHVNHSVQSSESDSK